MVKTGVTTDEATRINAYIMIASALLYLSPQIPTFVGKSHDPFMAWAGGVACLTALAAYCVYQVRMPELQKRAYLAKFLVNVDVPEHMFSDEEICEVYQQYQDLQGEFKEAHKAAEKFKSQLISPDEIKKAILQMEEDKRQL